MTERPLADIRVVDLVQGPAGAFAGKLLTTLGADLIKVEPRGGDPLRGEAPFLAGEPGADRALRWHNHRGGARSVVLDPESSEDREQLLALIASADALIENYAPGGLAEMGLGPDVLHHLNPALVLTSVTPFGQDGPRSHWQGPDIVGYAMGGMMALTGEPTEPPVRLGGAQANQLAGMYAVVGLLCALTARARTGLGRHVDVSIQESVAAHIADAGITYYQFNDRMNPERVGTEHPVVVPCGIFPCDDGYIIFNCLEPHQYGQLVAWLGEQGGYVEPLEAPEFAVAMNRLPARDLINTLLGAAAASLSKAIMYPALQGKRVPCAPVSSVADLASNPQLLAREFFKQVKLADDGPAVASAGSPFRFTANQPPTAARAPRLDEHRDEILGDLARRPALKLPRVSRRGRRWSDQPRALDGVRVIDFSWALAGPWAGRMLAHEGAEVIRVESATRLDALRLFAHDPEKAGTYINANAGKLGVSLELTAPGVGELAQRLAASADVVLDNFRPGVMQRLGLAHEDLAALNPEIITCSLPAQGETGPHREYVAYAPVLTALAGFTNATGYAEGRPTAICTGFIDQLASAHAVAAVLAALHHRDRTGEGQHIELSQFEAAVGMLDTAVLEYFANGSEPGRRGNRDENAAPHGIYPCAGEDQWLAICAGTDEQWRRLASAIERQDLLEDERLATLAGRLEAHAELDTALGEWSAPRDAEAAMSLLQEAGVPAGKVQRVGDMLERDPHMIARRFYESTDHPVMGKVMVDGAPFRILQEDGHLLGRAGPLMGQDTRAVLEEILGLQAAEIDELAASGGITCTPDPDLERRLGADERPS